MLFRSLTVSRSWGTTFGAVRATRAGYAKAQTDGNTQRELVTTRTLLGRGTAPAVQGRRRRPLDVVKHFVTPGQTGENPGRQQMRAAAGGYNTVTNHEQF